MSQPTALARAIQDQLRTEHANCDPATCPLSRIWAEDVQEILDAARAHDPVTS